MAVRRATAAELRDLEQRARRLRAAGRARTFRSAPPLRAARRAASTAAAATPAGRTVRLSVPKQLPRGRHVRGLADPRSTARTARENKIPTVLLLFLGLVALQVWRAGGKLPSGAQVGGYTAMALAFVFFATIAPDFVTWTLLVALLFVALTSWQDVQEAVQRFLGWLPRAPAPGSVAPRERIGGF